MLDLQFYFLSPVQIVKVTTQNLQEVAEWCGGKVAKTESRRVAGRMDSYVWVPTPKGTSISWAFPGMFITKRLVRTVKDEMRVTYAVFRKDYFEKNYFDSPTAAVAQTWEKGMKTPNTKNKGPNPGGAPKKNLNIDVSVPPGASAEEVKEAMDVAVGVLQEQGVLPKADPEGILANPAPPVPTAVEEAALQAIVDAEPEEDVLPPEVQAQRDAANAQANLSPREVHDEQIAQVVGDESAE